MTPIGLKDLFVIFSKPGWHSVAARHPRRARRRVGDQTQGADPGGVPDRLRARSHRAQRHDDRPGCRLRHALRWGPRLGCRAGGADPPRVHTQRDLQRRLFRARRHRISRRRATDHPAGSAGVHRHRRAFALVGISASPRSRRCWPRRPSSGCSSSRLSPALLLLAGGIASTIMLSFIDRKEGGA